jgi:hypothetical protein
VSVVVAACGSVTSLPDATPVPVDASVDAPPAHVADSTADFADVQGAGGWHYLYQEPMASPALKEMVYDAENERWVVDPTKYWSQITYDQMHPNVNGMQSPATMIRQDPVRRWIANAAGTAAIRYHVAKADRCGDGVTARIVVDGVVRGEHTLAADDTVGLDSEVSAPIAIGSTIDLVLDAVAEEGCDGTVFTATITVE